MGGQGPGIQQRGQMMAQQQQRPPQQPQQGIAAHNQLLTWLVWLVVGLFRSEKVGRLTPLRNTYGLSEKLKNPNISPEAAQAITMTLEAYETLMAQDEGHALC